MMKAALTAILFFVSLSIGYAAPVPDTGQTQSYTSTFGEDSDYSINPHFYTDLGNGIVRDNVTGLDWVKVGNLINTRDSGFDVDATTGDGAVTWQHALDYVAKLNNESYLGYKDWRLPTIKELSTLSDKSIPDPGPTINTTYFPSTMNSYYWSSTTDAGSTDYAWLVYFKDGGAYYGYKTGYKAYVRAVRSGQSGSLNNLITNDDGTVTDISTGLMWQQATAPSTYNWEQALTYCENLILNNDEQWTSGTPNASGAKYNDWRLPNINELQSIVDYSRYNLLIDTTYFPGTMATNYWSSTTFARDINDAWNMDFGNGYMNFGDINGPSSKADFVYVRAVRSGKCGFFGDSDLDGICDDGDVNGVVGDNPCRGGNTMFCDDSCPAVANPDQTDTDNDGIGDACDTPTCTNACVHGSCTYSNTCACDSGYTGAACDQLVNPPPTEPTPIYDPSNGEENLYKIVNRMVNTTYNHSSEMTDIQLLDADDDFWKCTEDGEVVVEVRYAGYDQELGLVGRADQHYETIVPRDHIINGAYKDHLSYRINYAKEFAFVEKFWNGNTLGTWYSDDRGNPDLDHFVALDVKNSPLYKNSHVVNHAWIIAWEDSTLATSDRDYNDLVCLVLDVKPTFAEEIILNADPADGKVIINWKAISEKDVLGYNIYRTQGLAGKFEKINDSLIQGKGSIQTTVDYEFTDADVTNGLIYQYKLEEVGTEGLKLFHGPVKAWPLRIYNLLK